MNETDVQKPIFRKQTYIESIQAGTGADIDLFQIVEIAEKQTKDRGSPYLDMIFADRTGRADAKGWDMKLTPELRPGAIVKAEYAPDLYRGALQLKILRMRVLAREEVEIDEFLPASKRDRDEMMRELSHWIGSIENQKLKDALIHLVHDLHGKLRDAPAAKSNHHAYIGGLMEHTLNLLGLVKGVCAVHPTLNRDVLIAGAILHDIGKIYELEYTDSIAYSVEGSVVGHIAQGLVIWARYYSDVDMALRLHVAHLILSHHGYQEWGSPVVPKTREAYVFHCLDLLDSHLNSIEAALTKTDERGMTGWDRTMETYLWDGMGLGMIPAKDA